MRCLVYVLLQLSSALSWSLSNWKDGTSGSPGSDLEEGTTNPGQVE